MRLYKVWWLLLLGIFLIKPPACDAAAQQPTPALDPVAITRQMCDYLKSLKQFSFRTEVTYDQVYEGGKPLQYGLDMQTYVKRPDRLRVSADGDLENKEFFLNGKTITLYDKPKKVYATMEVPPNIEGALDKAHKEFGLRVATTDLASPLLWEHVSKGLENPVYAGLHKVRGILCHHVAFDKDDVYFQVWIDAGDKPLPRKIIFTKKKVEGFLRWTGYVSDWKTSIALDDGLFSFLVPLDAQEIRFVPARPAGAQGKQEGGKP
jgi:hypothetical protein